MDKKLDKIDKYRDFALGKQNLILIGIGLIVIIIGFILMVGEPSGENVFNPEIFNFRRTVLSSGISLFGFLFVIYGILMKTKHE
jgi:multisubunit Na+/H+ antiporter MnhB subunit